MPKGNINVSKIDGSRVRTVYNPDTRHPAMKGDVVGQQFLRTVDFISRNVPTKASACTCTS